MTSSRHNSATMHEIMKVLVKKLDAAAKAPTYAHPGDAGMDLYALTGVTIEPGERVLVPTGIACAIPSGFVGLIWDKSGVAAKRGLKTLAGVVDSGYRGEVMVALFNTSKETQTFDAGDKLAQMLIQPVESPEVVEVEELDDTSRGEGAFGSTGK